MVEYIHVPMDFADASLVAVAENYNLRTIFTLDSDFAVYRIRRGYQYDLFNVIG